MLSRVEALRLMKHLFSIKKLFMNTVPLTVIYVDFSFSLLQKGKGVFVEQKGEKRTKKNDL